MKEIDAKVQEKGGEMCRPIESRKRVLDFIRDAGRPVKLKEVLDLAVNENLWFGPGVDTLDFLFAKQVLGSLHIDLKANEVISSSKSPDKQKSVLP